MKRRPSHERLVAKIGGICCCVFQRRYCRSGFGRYRTGHGSIAYIRDVLHMGKGVLNPTAVDEV